MSCFHGSCRQVAVVVQLHPTVPAYSVFKCWKDLRIADSQCGAEAASRCAAAKGTSKVGAGCCHLLYICKEDGTIYRRVRNCAEQTIVMQYNGFRTSSVGQSLHATVVLL